jgi:hypothetical protein
MTLIAGIGMTDLSLSLRDIGAQLERMRERTQGPVSHGQPLR